MPASRGMFVDESPRRRVRRKEKTDRMEPTRQSGRIVNARPVFSTEQPKPIAQPKPVDPTPWVRSAPIPDGPRTLGVVEQWKNEPRGGYGFAILARDGQRVFVSHSDLRFNPALVDSGVTIEFAVEEVNRAGRLGLRARHVTLAGTQLPEQVPTRVLAVVTGKYALLENPHSERSHIFMPLSTWPSATVGQRLIAHVIQITKGWRAVKVEPIE